MNKEYYYSNIQKIHEGKDYCTYEFEIDGKKQPSIEISGYARELIDALGNALLKESFQKFEKN